MIEFLGRDFRLEPDEFHVSEEFVECGKATLPDNLRAFTVLQVPDFPGEYFALESDGRVFRMIRFLP